MLADMLARNADKAESLVSFNGMLGDYSLGLHLVLMLGIAAFLVGAVWVLALVRGRGRDLAVECTVDLVIGFLCAMSVIAFLGFFYFVGRGFYRASMR